MGDPVKVTIGENNEDGPVLLSNIYSEGATNGGSKNTEKVAYGYPVLATNGDSKNKTKVEPIVGDDLAFRPTMDESSKNVKNWT